MSVSITAFVNMGICTLCYQQGRPRSTRTTPEVEEDILDVVNETPGVIIQKVSMQVA
jgi:hypothetical protein